MRSQFQYFIEVYQWIQHLYQQTQQQTINESMSKQKRHLPSYLKTTDNIDLRKRYKSTSFPKKTSRSLHRQTKLKGYYIVETDQVAQPTLEAQRREQKIKTKYYLLDSQPPFKELSSHSPYKQKSASFKAHQHSKQRDYNAQVGQKKHIKITSRRKKKESQQKSEKSKSTRQKKQPSTNQFSHDRFSKTYRVTVEKQKSCRGKETKSRGIRWQEVLEQYGEYLTVAEIGQLRELKMVYFLGKIKERKSKYLFSMHGHVPGSARKHHNCSQTYQDEKPFYNQLLSERRQDIEGDNQLSLPADDFYRYEIGDHVAYRYQIIGCIDKGAFGEVLKVFDHKRREYLAMKIVKKCPQLVQQTLVQISLLTHISDKDKDDLSGIVKIRDFTIFRKHICIIFELLEGNLFDLIVANNYNGMTDQQIRIFGIQLLNSLDFLRREKIIHCDLKPENIVLRKWGKSGIKIIDFGTSCFEGKQVYTYLQSRYYRAPEIILGTSYSFPIDMWSLGCILAELKLGQPIFAAGSDLEQLMYITNSIGFPKASAGPASERFLQAPEMKQLQENNYIDQYHRIKNRQQIKGHPLFSKYRYIKHSMVAFQQRLKEVADEKFIALVEKMLVWQPSQRITPAQALKDQWIISGLRKDLKNLYIKINQTRRSSKSKSKSKDKQKQDKRFKHQGKSINNNRSKSKTLSKEKQKEQSKKSDGKVSIQKKRRKSGSKTKFDKVRRKDSNFIDRNEIFKAKLKGIVR